jgi:hypothetical protein
MICGKQVLKCTLSDGEHKKTIIHVKTALKVFILKKSYEFIKENTQFVSFLDLEFFRVCLNWLRV